MSAAPEPRDGDFVAYVEELQRESAARLQIQSTSALVQPAERPARTGRGAGLAMESTPLTRPHVDQLLSRLASQRATAHLLGPVIGLLVGLALFFKGAVFGGLPSIFIGFALAVWSTQRLTRALRARAPGASAQTVVSEFFGKPPGA
jgi:predicted lipid-binding transport protein (Tim44 family)